MLQLATGGAVQDYCSCLQEQKTHGEESKAGGETTIWHEPDDTTSRGLQDLAPIACPRPTGPQAQLSEDQGLMKNSVVEEMPPAAPVEASDELQGSKSAGREENSRAPRFSTHSGTGERSNVQQWAVDGAKPVRRSSRQTGALGKPFPKRPMMCKLSAEAWRRCEEFFYKIDKDRSNAVTLAEAETFFRGAFGKMSAMAMFNEVDVDRSGAITAEEFMKFWIQVRNAGYKEQDVLDELDMLIEGGSWVDWNDGRDTLKSEKAPFPKRPWMCSLSAPVWNKCRELFEKIDVDKQEVIAYHDAERFFKGSFAHLSAQAMFHEIDVDNHGVITPKEWMKFWQQVRASGYSNKHITEELISLLEGNAWVDWKDQRTT